MVYIRLVAIAVLVGLSSCKIRVICQRWRKKNNPDLGRMGCSFHFMQTKKIFLPMLAPNRGGDLRYYERATLADGSKKCAASKYAEVLVFTEVFPGRDAPDSSYGTASFPPTPLHVTGLALNAAREYRGREGREKIHYKPDSPQPEHSSDQSNASVGCDLSLPPPEQQRDRDTNKRGQSLRAVVFQPLRPDPLAHIRSAADPHVYT